MAGSESIWALVPVRSFRGAKERLSAILTPAARTKLARAMLDDVLSLLQASDGLAGVAVTSPDEAVLDEARRFGALPLREPVGSGLNGGLDFARKALVEHGADALLVLPGDVPQLDPVDLQLLLAAMPAPGVVVAQADDGGTTGLFLRPPVGVPFCFGPDSGSKHQVAATALGLRCAVVRPASLTWDVDRPDDLARLAESALAAHSRAVLRRYGIVAGKD